MNQGLKEQNLVLFRDSILNDLFGGCVSDFYEIEPSLENYWRAVILFGRNVASYKFALAKSLLEMQPQSGQLIKMSDIAPVFSRHITEHLKIADKQGTSRSSNFLDACRKFNSDEINENELL